MIHSVVSSRSALVCEGEFAVDGQAVQRRWADVEDHFLAGLDGDLVTCGGHLVVRPGGRIRPVRRLGLSRFSGCGHTAEQECWNEQRKKERTILSSHGRPPFVFPDYRLRILSRRIARVSGAWLYRERCFFARRRAEFAVALYGHKAIDHLLEIERLLPGLGPSLMIAAHTLRKRPYTKPESAAARELFAAHLSNGAGMAFCRGLRSEKPANTAHFRGSASDSLVKGRREIGELSPIRT